MPQPYDPPTASTAPGDLYGCGTCKAQCGPRLTMLERAQYLGQAISDQKPDPEPSLAVLVALSEAESAGYAGACHKNSNGTFDRGFMKINSTNAGTEVYDPELCATAAIRIYQSQGYGAWSTYNNPRYLAALPGAVVAAKRAGQPHFGGHKPGSTMLPGTGQGDGSCVYRWGFTIPIVPGVLSSGVSEGPCLDTVVGFIKMTIGGIGVLITGLALVWVISRAVPGAAEASKAAGKATSLLPAGRVYKTTRKATSKAAGSIESRRKPPKKTTPAAPKSQAPTAPKPPRPRPDPGPASANYRPRPPRPSGHRPARRPAPNSRT